MNCGVLYSQSALDSLASLNQKCQDIGYISDDKNSNGGGYNSEYVPQPNYAQTNPFFAMPSEDHTSDSDSATIDARTAKASVASTNEDISADLHIIAHVTNLVSVQIDHYQYLFLLRLAEEMTELSTFLTVDSKRILNENDESKSIVVGCVIPQVEVTLVMPSQTPGKESTGGDGESVLPDSASIDANDLHFNSNSANAVGVSNWPLNLDQIKNHQNTNTFGSIETPSPVTNEAPDAIFQQFEQTQHVQYTSSPNTHGFNVQIVGTASSTSSTSTPQSSTTPVSRGKNRNSMTDSGLNIGSSLISMKKGFSSFMTSIDSALKTNMTDDMSDTISIQSDISSDSENYVILSADDKTADCMDVMFKYAIKFFFIGIWRTLIYSIVSIQFRLNPFNNDGNVVARANAVEVASEVCEEIDYKTNMSSPSEPSEASTWRRRDLVSMVTFRLTTVELIRQNRGPVSAIRVQVAAVSCDECGAIPWDEFQVRFVRSILKDNFSHFALEIFCFETGFKCNFINKFTSTIP